MSLVTTFVVSGFLHDAAVSAVRAQKVFILTPWFFVLGVLVVMGRTLQLNYSHFVWPVRALINICYLGVSLALILVLI